MKTSMNFKKKILASVISASMVAVALAPASLMAQTAAANLRGKATPGANVTVKNPQTGLTRSTRVGADGSYSIIGLPPATYQVDAGPGTQQSVTLSVASTATLNLVQGAEAPVAATANSAQATTLGGVSVQATTLAEVKTPEVGQTISLHQIQNIPQVSRNFLEFADTVPGMVFSVDAKGHTSLRGGAQNENAVNVFIDGVGQKNYVKGGGITGQSGSQGNPFPQLAIGEYKVITSNYKAEYDQVSSAAITAETKSGTNEFHGEVFDTYTSDKYRSRTASEEDADKARSFEKERGFALGGPIIKDQMHFFVTYEEKKFDTPTTVAGGDQSPPNLAQLLPASAASQLGPNDLPFNEKLYFGKIDWELTDRDRVEISTQVRRETQADIPVATTQSASTSTINHDTRGSLRWQHSGDSFFNEFKASYENSSVEPTPINFGNGAVYTYNPTGIPGQNDPTVLSAGAASPLSTQIKGQEGPSLADDFTFNDLSWHGDHTVKIGAKYKEVTLHAQDAQDTNPQFFYDVSQQAGTAELPYKVQFSNPYPGLNPISETTAKQYGIYAQDDWAVNDHLTLNLGVRWDYEKTPSYLDFQTPQGVIDAINSQDPRGPAGQTYAQSMALGGVDINKYISTGNNRKAFNGEWQPRLGFSYDLFADEAHVIHGGAGRSYDRNLYDYLQLEQTKLALPIQTLFFNGTSRTCDLASPDCRQFDPVYLQGLQNLQGTVAQSNAGREVDLLNNKLKAPYSDQYSLGMSNKVGDWQTDATISRVLTYDGFAFTFGNRTPTGGYYNDTGGLVVDAAPVPGYGALVLGDNGIRTLTTQVLLSAQKPYTKDSGWSSTFAYTYSHAKQNRDVNEHYSFDEPSIQDYPFITSNAVAKHRFVATGALDGPWGISFSAKLTVATPLPFNGNENYGIIYPNGSNSRPVAEIPHGSKFLFGGDIWGYRDIDVQARKDFVIAGDTTLYVRFDVLNVFNWKNFAQYTSNFGTGGMLNQEPVVYNKKGDITFVPRTARFTVGLKF